ncbi:hypothetical protein CGI39_24155 [Vibrio parahaemolyticus]|nr:MULTISPECIES: HEPN domain-containing protein [Vibrio]EGS6501168.1 hypothetical protein [Vibrio parahaemolyticus]ELF4880280.1 hypothetical protein [Vibrio parahaemolyticus]MBE4408650.1 hypothetical protein [Vibrio parahaemolyticus]MBM4801080.1 hypothetical protein [Vibrio parahaemolyticus]MBM4964236.1 hypothetical protein [Vibrio parahaemolyticus]
MKNSNQEYLSMAIAYIEIGKVAASSNSDLINTHEFENAIAYQLYHSVELFYKYMLLNKGVTKKGHDLAELENEYRKYFAKDKFKLNHPFDFSDYEASSLNPSEEEMVNAHLRQFKPEFMDQHLRYPSNHNTGGYSYKFDAPYFDSIKAQMLNIAAIDC